MDQAEILIPNACPVCGCTTVPSNNEQGWNCTDEDCVWAASADPA